MSQIAIRNKNEAPAAQPSYERDPFRLIRDFFRWDPFREMAPLWAAERAEGFAPAFEVKETREGYVFKADLPGIKESDLEITMTGSRLSVSGKREAEKEEKSDTFYTYERSYGSFARAFTLPEGIDAQHVRAELKDGVLTLVVPKKPEVQPQKIEVRPASTTRS
jgi:HSP20 family protein